MRPAAAGRLEQQERTWGCGRVAHGDQPATLPLPTAGQIPGRAWGKATNAHARKDEGILPQIAFVLNNTKHLEHLLLAVTSETLP